MANPGTALKTGSDSRGAGETVPHSEGSGGIVGGQGAPGSPAAASTSAADTMTLQNLTKFHDEEFVKSAYRTLLRRDPDPVGLQNYLKQLRSGRMNKIEILGDIHSSAEGRQVGVEVTGLKRAYLFQRLFAMPLVGRVLKTAEVAWRLPTIMRNVDGFQAFTCARFSELQNLAAARMGLNASSVLTQRLSALQTSLETERANRDKLEDIVAALERNLQDLTAAVC